jgi:hypothetical protein
MMEQTATKREKKIFLVVTENHCFILIYLSYFNQACDPYQTMQVPSKGQ